MTEVGEKLGEIKITSDVVDPVTGFRTVLKEDKMSGRNHQYDTSADGKLRRIIISGMDGSFADYKTMDLGDKYCTTIECKTSKSADGQTKVEGIKILTLPSSGDIEEDAVRLRMEDEAQVIAEYNSEGILIDGIVSHPDNPDIFFEIKAEEDPETKRLTAIPMIPEQFEDAFYCEVNDQGELTAETLSQSTNDAQIVEATSRFTIQPAVDIKAMHSRLADKTSNVRWQENLQSPPVKPV